MNPRMSATPLSDQDEAAVLVYAPPPPALHLLFPRSLLELVLFHL